MDYESLKNWLLAGLSEIESKVSENCRHTFKESAGYYCTMVENLIFDDEEPSKHLDIRMIKDKQGYFNKCLSIEKIVSNIVLPIYKNKNRIVNAITYHNFFILISPTGTGKSSQVPLFFLCSPIFQDTSILIIESNKLSAKSLSTKVKEDLLHISEVKSCTNPNKFSNTSSSSLIYFDELTFLSILLEESLSDNPFPSTKVIILDDIHEYNSAMEVILCLLLRIIKTKRPDLRLTFFSASLNDAELESYLSTFFEDGFNLRPGVFCEDKLLLRSAKIKVTQKLFDIKEIFANEGNYNLKETSRVVERVLLDEDSKKIMVFVASDEETYELKSLLNNRNDNLTIFIANKRTENISSKLFFRKLQPFERMIIIATNFFEGAITIPDVTHVIDTGKEKTLQIKGIDVYESSKTSISMSSAIQRRGRTGRESVGSCILLYTEAEQKNFQPFRSPKIDSEALDSIFLILTKHRVDPWSLELLHPLSQMQFELTYRKLWMMEALDVVKLEEPHQSLMTEIGELAMQLKIEVFQASMIIRGRFYFESILMACVIESSESFIDYQRQSDESYLFFNQNIDDFTIQLVLARHFCSIRCENCAKLFQNFSPRSLNDYLQFISTSCKNCAGLRNAWGSRLKIRGRLIKLALKVCRRLLKKIDSQGKTIKTLLNDDHYAKEQKFMNNTLDLVLGRELLQTYLKLADLLKILVLKVFSHNICENISNSQVTAFRHMRNEFIAVPGENSFYKAIKEKDFIVCKFFEKNKNRYRVKLAVGFSYEEIKNNGRAILKNFQVKKHDFQLFSFPNVGEKFSRMLKVHDGRFLDKVEEELSKKLESFLMIYSKSESCFKVLTKKQSAEDCSRVMNFCIRKLFNLIEINEKVHHSVGDNYLAILSLGYEIKELVSPKNEIRYKITGLDTSVPAAMYIKDIKKTFAVKYISIEKVGNLYEAFLYFSNHKEAEEAQRLLRILPLKGSKAVKEKIFEMEPLTDGAFKGKSAKVVIPCYVDFEVARKVLGFFDPAEISLKKCTSYESVIYVHFKSREAAEYFVHNYRPTFQSHLSVSSASVKIVADGISIPKELCKVSGLEKYVNLIRNTYRAQVYCNLRKKKIFSQFDELSLAAQQKIFQLVNNDTLEVPQVVWNMIVNSFHFIDGEEFNFEEFQLQKDVSCIYVQNIKMIQIFGLPEERAEFLEYLKHFISDIMNDLVTVDFEIDKKKKKFVILNELFSRFPNIDFMLDDQNSRKFTASGISKDIQNLSTLFYDGKSPLTQIEECEVCGKNKSKNSHKLGICGHSIHKSCFVDHLKSNMTASLIPITCFLCQKLVCFEDLVMICPYEIMKLIEKIALSKFIKCSGKDRFEVCEIPNCGYIYEKNSIDIEKMTRYCPKCNFSVCIKCKSPATLKYHSIECEKRWIFNNDRLLTSWLMNNASTCPKCGISIEKSGGCNHMTCDMCGVHYCFICLKEITEKPIIEHYSVQNTLCYRRYINPGSQ